MAAVEGTTTASLRILNAVLFGKFRISCKIIMPAIHITAVAIMVFSSVMGNLCRIEFPSFFRSTKSRIVTCKYEQIAVESASPAVPMYHIRVRLRKMFTITAIIALLIGVFESCIEKNALATIC